MKTKKNPLAELKQMLNENSISKNKRQGLLEGILSEDDFNTPIQDEVLYDDDDSDFPLDGSKGGEGDMIAKERGILPIKNEIDQIRQIALKTIARLAENPVSESYQMMKKIWIMCDKAIESALQPEENNKKSNTGGF